MQENLYFISSYNIANMVKTITPRHLLALLSLNLFCFIDKCKRNSGIRIEKSHVQCWSLTALISNRPC